MPREIHEIRSMKLKLTKAIYTIFLFSAQLCLAEEPISIENDAESQIQTPYKLEEHDRSILAGQKQYINQEGFIANREQLNPYMSQQKVVIIASPGRSGSTMLTEVAEKYAAGYRVLKTHLLPPENNFKGKILFIFSNPDKAAESALRRVLTSNCHGELHFSNVETSDLNWFKTMINNGKNQTEKNNLLSYDALGYGKQLQAWLHGKSQPSNSKDAQILALKYEHLWDPETIQAIKIFLNLQSFELPAKRTRGSDKDRLLSEETSFRSIYNLGTAEEPRYKAYDEARKLWEQALPFQFLRIMDKP